MCLKLGVEDVAVNALIELLAEATRRVSDAHRAMPFVSFTRIQQYGALAVKKLREENRDVVLIYSRDGVLSFVHDYSRYFRLEFVDGEEGIRLCDGVTEEDLWTHFRSQLPFFAISAFADQDIVKCLFKKAS